MARTTTKARKKQPVKKSTVNKTAPKKQPVKKTAVKQMSSKKIQPKKTRINIKWVSGILFFIVLLVSIWNVFKPLPAGISKRYEPSRTNDVKLLLDNSYEQGGMHYEQTIFPAIYRLIDEADDFIIMDMFLFNDAYDGSIQFPKLSSELTNHLIAKKRQHPDMPIYVLTDPINSFYGSYTPDNYKRLRDNGILVYETDLTKLRDSNPLYSGLWRSTVRWLGNSENGSLPNIFSKNALDVTVRGYARMLNFKANHRKTIVSEKAAIIASSNPHDPSGHHQNIAVKVSGQLQEDVIRSEVAAINMSGGKLDHEEFPINHHAYNNMMDYGTTLVTEGRIKETLLQAINRTNDKDELKMGMFYLADRDIIRALLDAADRGVKIKLILDVNKEAFGKEKPGVPNKPVAHELVAKSDDRIQIKWAVSHGEQFHAKYVLITDDRKQQATLFVGSANLTRRNIGDYNMETDAIITGKSTLPVFRELAADFDAKWTNEYSHVTDHYEVKKDASFLKTLLYRVQEFTGLSSF
ncbi:phospholipase D-like domain-containing protein [Macrococcus equipercicus]|nr:phospholipase D-like domain-containing protein [Macrococcus equipercicus]